MLQKIFCLIVSIAIAGCSMPSKHSSAEQTTCKEGWSEAVDGIQARFSFDEGTVQNGTKMIRVFLELRNVSDINNPRNLFFEPYNCIEAQLYDSSGKEIPQRQFNGFVNWNPFPVCLPDDNAIKINVTMTGWYAPNGEKAIIGLPSGEWEIKQGDTSEYFLGGTFTARNTFKSLNEKACQKAKIWFGTIQIPKARVNVLNNK